MKIQTIIVAAMIAFGPGCDDQAEVQKTRGEVASLKQALEEERGRSMDQIEDLKRKLQAQTDETDRLIVEKVEILDQLSTAMNELAAVSSKLAKYDAQVEKIRQAKAAEQTRRKYMLAAAKAANKPADYPFRAFDVIYIGKKTYQGLLQDCGVFSIRNYTGRPLTGRAICAGRNIEIVVPANSVKQEILMPAAKNQPLVLETNLGKREYAWTE